MLLLLVCLCVSGALGCETGVAFVKSILSVERSLLANADVAFLKAYNASTLNQCLEECCAALYGACSVASLKKNASGENCLHFNCRPLHKCKFLSSDSTDSFTFSANPVSLPTTVSAAPERRPGSPHKSQNPTEPLYAKEPKPGGQFAVKNDNTTVKPRKGVDVILPDTVAVKSGVKPRKGVGIEDVPHSELLPSSLNRSNVKPRKGVGPYWSTSGPRASTSLSSSISLSTNDYTASVEMNTTDEDVMFDLVKVFEDDTMRVSDHSTTAPFTLSIATIRRPISEVSAPPQTIVIQSTAHPVLYSSKLGGGSNIESSISQTPPIQHSPSVPTYAPTAVEELIVPLVTTTVSMSATMLPTGVTTDDVVMDMHRLPHAKTLAKDYVGNEEIEESDRRYKSSMHLVLSLVFGLLVLFAVLGVVAKRIYDGWVRRDYYRMNYLIDGIYNGVE